MDGPYCSCKLRRVRGPKVLKKTNGELEADLHFNEQQRIATQVTLA